MDVPQDTSEVTLCGETAAGDLGVRTPVTRQPRRPLSTPPLVGLSFPLRSIGILIVLFRPPHLV